MTTAAIAPSEPRALQPDPAPAEAGVRTVRRASHPLRRVSFWVAAAFIALVATAALWPSLLAPQDPLAIDLGKSFDAPSAQHVFGTDQSGRDVYSRVVHGAGQSVLIGVGATALGLAGAVLLGVLGGLGGRAVDAVVTRVIEVLYAFPGILLALILIAVFGSSAGTQILAVGIATIPGYARMVRGQVLAVRGAAYVQAEHALGHSSAHVLFRTLLPNAFRPLTVLVTLGIGQAIVWASALGFLGMGVQPPAPEWGAMLNAGRNYLQQAWWLDFWPGVVIVLLALSLTAVGRALQTLTQPGGPR
ncbi:ABC transporter permease [Curtobacterium sp. MCJR17_020]|uniref:ABC transporter permease n=1 Tax=Curtobacterium sp. MCJR17_020 TaxID=2175619 RepID=UPI0011B4713C|nr:ABC transporter permease [Curtobacterium sp. MCJR17_020]WIE71347.1 ABC transporter permease [Curtobacterium sp. MCJR17_020]